MKQSPGLFLALVLVVTIAAGFFIYPSGFGLSNQPWKLGLDLVGGSHLIYNVDLSKVSAEDHASVLGGLRDVIERRVNLFGVSEPQVYIAESGASTNLVVELAGVKSVNEAINQIGLTPLLDFREVEQNGSSTEFIQTNLSGQYISKAQLSFNSTTGAPEVSITFNDEGAKIFEQITEANIGKPLAIFLDNELIEMPTVQTKISGGSAVITGSFGVQEAKKMVERFNAGALPAPINLINQQTVSASLGSDSLSKALLAGALGTLLVMLFMVIYYRYLGIFAVIALIIYIFITLGLFKLIPVTMSLAGLAGFILTIGMAVDANILIFERTREELGRGLSRKVAIEEGFRRAWTSIRDSNVSTIITAIILYFFTSSFIKGFALTLLIGVLVSMFSSITTTRLLLRVFIKDKVIKS